MPELPVYPSQRLVLCPGRTLVCMEEGVVEEAYPGNSVAISEPPLESLFHIPLGCDSRPCGPALGPGSR